MPSYYPERGDPFLDSYTIKGFFNDACGLLYYQDDSLSNKLVAHKRVIDGQVFIKERLVALNLPAEMEMQDGPCIFVTPLLGFSDKGVLAGTTATFTVTVLDDTYIPAEILTEWFDYGRYHGMGKQNGSGYGRFTYEMTEIEEAIGEEVIPPDKQTV